MKLVDLKVPELREKAHSLGIEGVDQMKKAELIEAIESAQGESDSGPAHDQSPADNVDLGSRSEKTDYQNHPKWHKFKTGDNQP